jgi:hypothetical protein
LQFFKAALARPLPVDQFTTSDASSDFIVERAESVADAVMRRVRASQVVSEVPVIDLAKRAEEVRVALFARGVDSDPATRPGEGHAIIIRKNGSLELIDVVYKDTATASEIALDILQRLDAAY